MYKCISSFFTIKPNFLELWQQSWWRYLPGGLKYCILMNNSMELVTRSSACILQRIYHFDSKGPCLFLLTQALVSVVRLSNRCVTLCFRCLPKLWRLLLLLLPFLLLLGEFLKSVLFLFTAGVFIDSFSQQIESQSALRETGDILTSTHPQSMLQIQYQIQVWYLL